MKIYIDFQNDRSKYRIRAIENNIDLAAYYADSKNEAERIKRFTEKVLSNKQPEKNTAVVSSNVRLETRNDLKEFKMNNEKFKNNRLREIKITYKTSDMCPEVLAEMVREQVLYEYDDVFGDPIKIEATSDDKKLEIIYGRNKVAEKVFLVDLNGLGDAYEISCLLTDPNYVA